jgi:hypothetical protein
MRIYARWVEIVFLLRIPIAFLCATTPRRWTAISMGALRCQTAIVSLSTAGVPIPLDFGHRASRPRIFFVRALDLNTHTR